MYPQQREFSEFCRCIFQCMKTSMVCKNYCPWQTTSKVVNMWFPISFEKNIETSHPPIQKWLKTPARESLPAPLPLTPTLGVPWLATDYFCGIEPIVLGLHIYQDDSSLQPPRLGSHHTSYHIKVYAINKTLLGIFCGSPTFSFPKAPSFGGSYTKVYTKRKKRLN